MFDRSAEVNSYPGIVLLKVDAEKKQTIKKTKLPAVVTGKWHSWWNTSNNKQILVKFEYVIKGRTDQPFAEVT